MFEGKNLVLILDKLKHQMFQHIERTTQKCGVNVENIIFKEKAASYLAVPV